MDKELIKKQILQPLLNAHFEAYFVGGCVRDRLLGKEPHDYDIVTSAKPEDIHRLFKNQLATVDINSEAFGIVVLNLNGENIEIATLRTDKNCDGRHAEVQFTESIEEDASRRDFTINALYEDINGEILDPTGKGKNDLEAGRIKFVGYAKDRCTEDCLRILRAVRFASVLGFDIDYDDQYEMKSMLHDQQFLETFFSRVSPERIGKEMRKVFIGKNALEWICFLIREFPSIFPKELMQLGKQPCNQTYHKSKDNLVHTLDVFKKMCELSSDMNCRIAALFHDLGKVYTQDENGKALFHAEKSVDIVKDFLNDKWRFTNAEIKGICDIIGQHMNMHNLWSYKPYKAFKFIHAHDFDALMKMLEADCCDSNLLESSYSKVMNRFGEFTSYKMTPMPEPLLKGDDLIGAGIMPGRIIGKALDWAYDQQLKKVTVRIKSMTNENPIEFGNAYKKTLLKNTLNYINQQ